MLDATELGTLLAHVGLAYGHGPLSSHERLSQASALLTELTNEAERGLTELTNEAERGLTLGAFRDAVGQLRHALSC